MPRRPVRSHPGEPTRRLSAGVESIRAEHDLPDGFDLAVLATAKEAAAAPRLPQRDRTDIPLFTIDPRGARDLDQAMHLMRDGEGYVVQYAVADVSAFVSAGDAVDEEARRRGMTCYGAAMKVPLHPPVLSEGAASLLPGEVRPAVLWTMRLDAWGHQLEVDVERARVRSTAQLDYDQAETILDGDEDHPLREGLDLLREIGRLRVANEAERKAVSLPIPDQVIEIVDDRWELRIAPTRAVEQWNAQISLMTGMAAAQIMLEGGIGILRTLPPPVPPAVERLRRTALGLGLDWPADMDYPEFVHQMEAEDPAAHAVIIAGTDLLRGADYASFDGEPPDPCVHAAIAAPYAHATAPIRRLVDRFALEICLSLRGGRPVPEWVMDALPELPGIMTAAGQRASRFERAVLDLAECLVLEDRIGEVFTGVVVERDERQHRGVVQIPDPAVEARIETVADDRLPLGRRIDVVLVEVDLAARRACFRPA